MHWPLRLLLVRHGQVASNRQMRYVGSRDEALTELGREQARAVGAALAAVPIAAVVSSPLRRASQTAREVAAGRGLEVRIDERLREQSFGEWEGLSSDEARARDPELYAAWSRCDDVVPPGGESQLAMQRRVLALIGEELEACAARQGDEPPRGVALVSHVGPIKAILSAALDIGLRKGRRLFLDPGTVSVVDWGATPIVRMSNTHIHGGPFSAPWIRRDVPEDLRPAADTPRREG